MAEDDIRKIKEEVEEMKNRIKEYGWGSVFLYVQNKTNMFNIFLIAYVELVNEGYITG